MSSQHPTIDDVIRDKTLKQALSFVGMTARDWVLDAIACHFHNEGYGLQGNTEKNDALWLARCFRNDDTFGRNDWDQLPKDRQDEYLKWAERSIKLMPKLIERIAQRYINAATAFRSIEEIERARRERMQKQS